MRAHPLALLLPLLPGNVPAQGPVSLFALRTDDRVVALASRDGRPLADEPLELRCWTATARRTRTIRTDATGLAHFELGSDLLPRTPVLVLRGDRTCAVAAIEISAPARASAATTAHFFCDRPVYRPGETVHGRVLLRESQFFGAERRHFASPLAHAQVRLELVLADGTTLARVLPTDADGCATFAVELPDDARGGTAVARVLHHRLVTRVDAFEVRTFRRPSVSCELGPAPVMSDDGSLLLDVRATFAAGGPAPALAGALEVPGAPDVPFVLDAHGFARVRVGREVLDRFAGQDAVELAAFLPGPEGVACRAEHRHVLRTTVPAPLATSVGERLVVSVRGRPGDIGLVGVAHHALLGAEVVRLDPQGRGEAAFTVARDWLPAVQVLGLGPARWYARNSWAVFDARPGVPVELAVTEALAITLDEAGSRFAPGGHAELHLRTVAGDGTGRPTVLAVAVVDEAVFAAFADRMLDPRSALAPRLDRPALRTQMTLERSCRSLALRDLFLGGWLRGWPALVTVPARGGGAAGGAATPGPGGAGEPPPRSRFEATAAFFGAVPTDASGRAHLRFRLPDDSTRWRVTVVAVGRGCTAATLREGISTEKDLAVTAALPRFLRAGDELLATRFVHRGRKEVVASPLRLHGTGLMLPVELEVREGAARDALRTSLPVLPAVASLPWCVTGHASGRTEIVPPPEAAAGTPCELVLLGGREAVLAEAARYVGEYPYGCVEQTTSRLLPHLAALCADRSPERERDAKIRAGLRRLRTMLVAPDRGFRYWPGWGGVDVAMSAYVVHALCLAREAGIDLRSHGLALAPEQGEFVVLARRIERCDPALSAAELDLGIALARYSGERGIHARALAHAAGRLQLSGVQHAAAALSLPRERAAASVAAALAADARAGMRAADLALLLIAMRRLGGQEAEAGRVEARLLRLHRDGRFGTTFDTAMATLALAGGSRQAGGGTFVVDVVQGSVQKSVRVSAGSAEGVRVPLPGSTPVVITTPADHEVVVLLRGRAPAGTAGGATRPTFELARRLVDADSGHDVMRFLEVGQRVRLVVELRDAGEHDYVAIDCPIPAGFEVLGDAIGWELHDDRAVFAIPRTGGTPSRAELTLIAAFAGDIAWPAATAVAMYDERRRGCTAPERLAILPR